MLVRLRLFLSSYAILFAILGLRFDRCALRLVCFVLALIGVVTTLMWLRSGRKIDPTPYVVAAVTDRGGEVAGYLATYLLPFVTVTNPDGSDIAGYVLYMGVAATIFIRSEMIHVNPLLYVFRLRLTSVRTTPGWSGFLISRDVPSAGDTVLAWRVSDSVLLSRG